MRWTVLLSLLLLPITLPQQARGGQLDEERIRKLETMLEQAQRQMAQLQSVMEAASRELADLKQGPSRQTLSVEAQVAPAATDPASDHRGDFARRILLPDLGGDQREHELSGRPELFIQSRYQALPINGATGEAARPNFLLTRMETRWSGKVSGKVGMGFELQYHPAPGGSSFEIVNDAFVEYYPNESTTIRAGQFVKPFGFDIQQSSSIREAPERGIFAGYFFPGQRDRGVMVIRKLDALGAPLRGVTVYGAALNGNRFFQDNNRQLNYNLRARKVFASLPLAVGISAQLGRQLLPPGVGGSNLEDYYGVDLQFVWRRLGVRGEYVAGNMPSTLIDIEPEFAPAFRPGAHSSAGAIFANVKLTRNNDIYWRYDQLNGDPVSGRNIRALNLGYFRSVGSHSRFGIDYQFKSGVTRNDDHVNTRLQLTWNVLY
ncbi:MAG: hypothetical protein HY235_12210 [Acidobacteria bacterium]|nr:hypothetical protein [Acidobacteriota bacterium]